MNKNEKQDKLWLAILIAFAVYAGLFIYRTSFIVAGERYFTLFDDAMISMTYARNLAHGHGLVWNAGGDRVEGYTNLLWTLYMGLVHLLPVATSKICLVVQTTSALLLLANLVFVRKLASTVSGGSRFASLGAVVMTAFYLPINNWSLQGMEVGLTALLVTLAAWKALEALECQRFSMGPYAVLALAMLTRLDSAVVALALLVFLATADRERGRRHLATGLILFGAAAAVQLGLSLYYYGDILPNTYYLKLAGYPLPWRLTRGAYVALVFIWRMNWVFFLVPVGLAVARRGRRELLLGSMFLAQLAYSIYVGGDAWESWGGANRYVCAVMPLFFVLFMVGLQALGGLIRLHFVKCLPGVDPVAVDRGLRRAGIAVILVALASFNAIYGPAALDEMLLLKKPLHVEENQKMVERALAVQKVTASAATVAVVWDGAIPYFAERKAISILGKNDRQIAREPMRTATGAKKLVAFYPGHLKWDYAYSIGQLKPDVVAQLWQEPESALPYLEHEYLQAKVDGFTFYFRSGSPNVIWSRVKASSTG